MTDKPAFGDAPTASLGIPRFHMVGTCKTCKHFKEHKPPHVPFTCVHPALRQDCLFSDPERFIPPSPDFGCTLHEAKGEQDG